MSNSVFLDASSLWNRSEENAIRYNIQQTAVQFEFPSGFTQIRLIEECRALNALDTTIPDNFDLLYDITMQMLVGKVCIIWFIDEKEEKHELAKFVVTDRYMNLRGVAVIDEYPVLVNWLVEYVADYLSKKYPHSYEDFQTTMSAREERMKSLTNQNKKQN